jgi:hypothetical protein
MIRCPARPQRAERLNHAVETDDFRLTEQILHQDRWHSCSAYILGSATPADEALDTPSRIVARVQRAIRADEVAESAQVQLSNSRTTGRQTDGSTG